MRHTITSMTITFVKNRTDDRLTMELMAMLSNGQIIQRDFPVESRVIRIDAESLDSPEITIKHDAEEDGA